MLLSLADVGTSVPLIILTPHPVSDDLSRALEQVIKCSQAEGLPPVQVVHVPDVHNPYHPSQGRFGGSIMSKIYIFGERIGARRIVYMDPDVLVLQNIDHLFSRVRKGMMSAAPDNGIKLNNNRPNTGVIGTMPDEETMRLLLGNLTHLPSYDGADQGFLTSYFVNNGFQGGWDKLAQSYNTLKRRYKHEDYNFDGIHCLHLSGGYQAVEWKRSRRQILLRPSPALEGHARTIRTQLPNCKFV